jgi:hypothetical protein
MLQQEGITINHYVVQLTPQYVDSALDRLLKVLGPDYFNICCGLAEDLVATTAKKYGGKAIMTAGGPDEAGRSYKNWTLQYKDNLDAGFYAVCDQFASSEGVRAGLVFGELGLENRVPLAFLIEESMSVPAEQKQIVKSWGDGSNPTTILMEDKIFWRQALDGILPKRSLRKPKETIHSASGAKLALQYVADNDQQYQIERQAFRTEAEKLGWFITFDDYCLWRWSKLEPEKFAAGANAYYGVSNGRELSYSFELEDKIARPICYDWLELN